MLEYTIRKLALGLLVIIVSTIILFFLMQVLPGGDPISLIADPRITEEKKQELRVQWGLDKPALVRFAIWTSNIAKGDLGTSILKNQPVATLMKERLPYTLALTLPSFILVYLLAVPLGLIAAYKKNTVIDKSIVVSALLIFSVPGFILAIFLIKVFSIDIKLFPISGYSGVISLVLPAATMILLSLASIVRILRSEVLGVINSRFVETAYAKGLTTRKVLLRHVLRNSLIPVTVFLFMAVPGLITGAIIIESVFALPGMGSLVFSSIMGHDYPVVQGIFLFIAILTVIFNTMGDIMTAILDPRVKQAMKGGQV